MFRSFHGASVVKSLWWVWLSLWSIVRWYVLWLLNCEVDSVSVMIFLVCDLCCIVDLLWNLCDRLVVSVIYCEVICVVIKCEVDSVCVMIFLVCDLCCNVDLLWNLCDNLNVCEIFCELMCLVLSWQWLVLGWLGGLGGLEWLLALNSSLSWGLCVLVWL